MVAESGQLKLKKKAVSEAKRLRLCFGWMDILSVYQMQ